MFKMASTIWKEMASTKGDERYGRLTSLMPRFVTKVKDMLGQQDGNYSELCLGISKFPYSQ